MQFSYLITLFVNEKLQFKCNFILILAVPTQSINKFRAMDQSYWKMSYP